MAVRWFNPKNREVETTVKKDIDGYTGLKDEVVVCVGGDGTILGAEIQYPGVPKLPIKSSGVCKRCCRGDVKAVLEGIKSGKVRPKEYIKLEAKAGEKRIVALNEINIASLDPRAALRFEYEGENVVGDGILVATPFGATGYFENITGTVFEVGIGVAFNNTNYRLKSKIIPEDREITIKIVRGPGAIYADNNSEWIRVETGGEIMIKKSIQKALIYSGL